jgi:ubiquinone/menaquinone biosynthesis C-methylase UbiE
MNPRSLQKNIWEKEHSSAVMLPSLAQEGPSSSVVMLIDYARENNITFGKRVVDIGCGKGRNALYLAEQGYSVYGFDYVAYAVECAQKRAARIHCSDRVTFAVGDMDRQWNFPDNYFDLAIDSYSSIDIESAAGRNIYKQELLRTLKPGGYACVAVVSSYDEYEKQHFLSGNGVEKYASVWPQTGKFQKNYDEQELREFYKEFNIIELKEYKKLTQKADITYMAHNYWLLLQKVS